MAGQLEKSPESVLAELISVRRRGLIKPAALDIPILREFAATVIPDDQVDLTLRLERILKVATERMGDAHGGAASLLLGIAKSSRGCNVTERRRQAANHLNMEPNAFERRHERGILNDLARQLMALDAEHRMQSVDGDDAPDEVSQEPTPLDEPVPQALSTPSLAELLDSKSDGHSSGSTGIIPGLDSHTESRPDDADGPMVFGGTGVAVVEDVPVPDESERDSHRPLLRFGLGSVGIAAAALVSVLAATSSWPFSSSPGNRGPGSQLSSSSLVFEKVSAHARLAGQPSSAWSTVAHIPAGDPVEWDLRIVDTASALDHTIVTDQIPQGVVVVPGSLMLYNGHYPTGQPLPTKTFQSEGSQIRLNIGDYLPQSDRAAANGQLTAQIIFSTEFVSRSPSTCARHVVTNNAWIGDFQNPHTFHASASAEVSC